MDEKMKTIDVVACYCEVYIPDIQFSIRRVSNGLVFFDDTYAIITPLAKTKAILGREELVFIERRHPS